jgi:hypothetical protein
MQWVGAVGKVVTEMFGLAMAHAMARGELSDDAYAEVMEPLQTLGQHFEDFGRPPIVET